MHTPAGALSAGSTVKAVLPPSSACSPLLNSNRRQRLVVGQVVRGGLRAMGWPRLAPALVLALHLILIAQNSHGATESECNSMSIKEEGILCYALEGECKCSRPCAVYAVRRALRVWSRKREENPVVNRPARAFKAHECGAPFLTTRFVVIHRATLSRNANRTRRTQICACRQVMMITCLIPRGSYSETTV